MHRRLLLVEDDASVREVTQLILEAADFSVDVEADGKVALDRAISDDYDAVILDVMLPSMGGFDVCRELRRSSRVPVLMLTARSDTTDIVVGLEVGADDYVTKPFEPAELVARVRSLVRRFADDSEPAVEVGDLCIDSAGFRAFKHDVELPLSATEFRLLLELARRPGQVFSRDLLLQRVWSYEYLGDSRLVDMAIRRLREKVEDDPRDPKLITTVRGVGYRLDA